MNRIACTTAALLSLSLPINAGHDPFAFFHPTVVLSPADRAGLASGEPLVRFLPSVGPEIGAFTTIAVSADVTAERALKWMRHVELLRENRYVIASQRLSTPPRLADFDRVVLDDGDLEEIRRCGPGRCGVKLAAPDMSMLVKTAAAGGSNWKPLVQQAFRRMLFERVVAFSAGGRAALADVVDKRRPATPAQAFAGLLDRTTFLNQRLPALSARLRRCVDEPNPLGESFIYWSNERLGGRPVITLTQATLVHGDGVERPLMMVGTQIYASHYLDGSLTVTAFLPAAAGSSAYFVYLHRSNVDLLSGFWGGIARSIIESRVRRDGPQILKSVGERMANGDPPSASLRHAWPAR